MWMPNFIIIGAAKSGTTALYEILKQHPQIYMTPVKEPNFFALEDTNLSCFSSKITDGYLKNCITDLESYQDQFKHRKEELLAGEASPIYLYHPDSAQKIKSYISNVKLIAILRDPAERAYSNYLHHIREGLEPISDFQQALELEELRIQENWWWGFFYKKAGLYYSQLEKYLTLFPRDQLKIIFYEDFQENLLETVQELFEYLGVDPSFCPNISGRYNSTGIPKNKALWNLISKSHPLKKPMKILIPNDIRQKIVLNLKNSNLKKPRISTEARSLLINFFRFEIVQLQDLVQRDLSNWLKVEK